ncbi:MAG: hemagglutinin repeat-containing protein, partial [Alphaproteobacteria bacterium]
TETSTAMGSSISGESGIDIASGDDTLISASRLQAGTSQNKADLNVSTGGDLTVASGKDTLERHERSSDTGFLSKQSARLDSYDERTVGSDLGASGTINLNAGKNAVISGSKVKAGDNLQVSGDSVSIIGAQEDHSLQSQKKESGLFAGSGGGFYSLWGKEQKDKSESITLNSGSDLSAGKSVILTARRTDLTIMGSHVEAGENIGLTAKRDVNILPGAESMSQAERQKRSGFGLQVSSGNGSASIGIGFGSSTDQTRQGADTNAISSLRAGRDILITAGRDANLQAALLDAGRDFVPVAGRNVNLLSAQDRSNYAAMHEKLFAGVSLTVSSGLVSAANNAVDAASRVSSASGTKAISNVAIAALNARQTLLDAEQALNGGTLVSGAATLGFEYSKNRQEGAQSTPVPTIIHAGRSIDITATKGTLLSRGAQILAGTDANGNAIVSDDELSGHLGLHAGKDVLLQSAQQ